jgi:hypothetical protein
MVTHHTIDDLKQPLGFTKPGAPGVAGTTDKPSGAHPSRSGPSGQSPDSGVGPWPEPNASEETPDE